MKRTVFAVSSGSYSDYAVHRLFERKEDAEQHLADRADIEASIEEFDLWPAGEQPGQYEWWEARTFVRAPDVTVPEITATRQVTFDQVEPRRIIRPSVCEHEQPTLGGETQVHIWAEAPDKDAAIKAVKDRAARVIASR